MIHAHSLCKNYGRIEAVKGIDFHIDKGEIIGFLGPNGAGKSTAMNMITGFLAPSSGKVSIGGIDMMESPEEAKKLLGYLPEQPPLYPDLTVMEYLSFVADFKKTPKETRTADLDRICDMVKIAEVRHRLIKNLSKGYRQRVGLAQALVGEPPLIILDEPTVGLDPRQIIEIRELIRRLGQEHTIVISSHILPEISATCSRVLIIDQGRIVASDTPENLSARMSGSSRLSLHIKGGQQTIQSALEPIENLKELSFSGAVAEGVLALSVETRDSGDIREEIFRAMAAHDCPILQMQSQNLSLEDIFLNLMTQEETV